MALRILLIVSYVDSERHEELGKVVDDLHSAEDGEAGEEPHGASDKPKCCLSRHLLIFLYFVKCCRGKVNFDKLDRTAVSAGHQSKSCSLYNKCEDIFFLEPFYFVTIFLPRSFLNISEGHLQIVF